MPANDVGSKVIIQIACINDKINQNIFLEKMLLRIADLKQLTDQLTDFIPIRIFH